MYEITNETKSTNKVQMAAGIVPAYLTSVAVETVGNPDKGETWEVLSFHFVSTLDEKSPVIKHFTHSEFQLDEASDKFKENLSNFNSKIKHIYEAFAPFKPISVTEENATFLDFLKAIAKSFNEKNEQNKTIFEGKQVNLKLVYNKKDKLSFPYSPNFIEKFVKNSTDSMLSINPKYDKIVITSGTAPSGNAPDDMPFL